MELESPQRQPYSRPGPGVDSSGVPVIDPTENVMALVAAAVRRQDDLRGQESQHTREIMSLRAQYQEKLSSQEAQRIDAMRAVDNAAVSRAAEVSAVQASTLASQVAAAAEAMRNQVAAAQAAAASALATALEPIQKSIDDLRKAQYEQQGQKYAQSENKDTSQWLIGAIIAIAVIAVQLLIFFVGKHQ